MILPGAARERIRMDKVKWWKKKEGKPYTMKKAKAARALRAFLWAVLVFLMVRGAVSLLKPDRMEDLAGKVEELQGSMAAEAGKNTRILAFAEEFVREWGTYTEEEEFKCRLEKYAIPSVLERKGLHDFTFSSEVTYANAYRSEEYAPGQYDVFVAMRSRIVGKVPQEDGTVGKAGEGQGAEAQQAVPEGKRYTLKVPVQVTDEGEYIVEGIPLIVEDSVARAGKYKEVQPARQVIEEAGAYRELVANFLEAYYGGQGQVLEYYIAQDADKGSLEGFPQGEMELAAVDEVEVYREAEGTALCLVKYQVRNAGSQELFPQECSIRIDDSGLGKLYIKAMDTKTINIRNTEG